MNTLFGAVFTALTIVTLSGCSETPTKSPDDVSVSQDRDKGVVTLTGTTISDAEKSQAESIAKSIAGAQVVSDQIAVRPVGAEDMAKKVDSDLDKGIEKNFDAMLVQHKLDSDVKYSVKNGVLTLTGKVNHRLGVPA
jgi:osmotically-inducible protein OsmY